MIHKMKEFIKKYFQILWIKEKFGPSVQIQQRQLYLEYKKNGKNYDINETGFKNFSQFEEDGILLYIFAQIGMNNKTFIEIGSNDGINSNCANLYFNFNWHGVFIDADKNSIERGKYFYSKYPNPYYYRPKFEQAFVTKSNINQLIEKNDVKGTIGLLSIDIDGNDYWIWDAINIVSPNVVIIETHVEFGFENIVVPYDEDGSLSKKHPIYHGASPQAMLNLGKRKGYRLVGANELGFNFIFVKEELARKTNLKEKSLKDILSHPSISNVIKNFDPIKNWEYITG